MDVALWFSCMILCLCSPNIAKSQIVDIIVKEYNRKRLITGFCLPCYIVNLLPKVCLSIKEQRTQVNFNLQTNCNSFDSHYIHSSLDVLERRVIARMAQ